MKFFGRKKEKPKIQQKEKKIEKDEKVDIADILIPESKNQIKKSVDKKIKVYLCREWKDGIIIAAPKIFDSEEKAKRYCDEQNEKESTSIYHKWEYEAYDLD